MGEESRHVNNTEKSQFFIKKYQPLFLRSLAFFYDHPVRSLLLGLAHVAYDSCIKKRDITSSVRADTRREGLTKANAQWESKQSMPVTPRKRV